LNDDNWFAAKSVLVFGPSKKAVAKQFRIPCQTLQVYAKRAMIDGAVMMSSVGRPTTLTDDQEIKLSEVSIFMSSKLFGLSPKVVSYCEIKGIEHQYNVEFGGFYRLRLVVNK
jgi:transposase